MTSNRLRLGILGGGQLGRMTALAAARLGVACHIYAPEPPGPAAEVADRFTQADWNNEAALTAFAADVDAITLEFENVPVDCARFLSTLCPVRPGASSLEIAQDRAAEKLCAARLGLKTAPWALVDSLEALRQALTQIGVPAILKTRRLGYDGHGQARIIDPAQAEAAWEAIKAQPAILEGFIRFAREISVILARDSEGRFAIYPLGENRHENGILAETKVPATISLQTQTIAIDAACRLAEALDHVGVLAVEMFVTEDGEVLVNEMAPRPHNSGHWTIDAAATSQFEQSVRCALGWPLGSVEPWQPCRMENLLGENVWARRCELLENGKARFHDYGKAAARAGRKMGHVTFID